MNENVELLEIIYENSNMGTSSTSDVLRAVKDKECKIKKLLEEINKGYEKFVKESMALLKKYKTEPQKIGAFSKMMASMGIKKEIMMDNSDAKIADMLIQGITMGNLEITKKIDNYEKVADQKVLNLAIKLKKFGEEMIEKLKPYL